MSGDKNKDDDTAYTPTRQELKEDLGLCIKKVREKNESGRIYNPETSKIRLKWAKAMGYLCQQYNQILKDEDLDEIKDRISKLEREIE